MALSQYVSISAPLTNARHFARSLLSCSFPFFLLASFIIDVAHCIRLFVTGSPASLDFQGLRGAVGFLAPLIWGFSDAFGPPSGRRGSFFRLDGASGGLWFACFCRGDGWSRCRLLVAFSEIGESCDF